MTHTGDVLRDRYGRHPLGQYLLMARRLVEAGVGFVSVNGWCGFAPGEGSQGGAASFTWDMHGGGMGQGNIFGTGSYGLGWALPRLDDGRVADSRVRFADDEFGTAAERQSGARFVGELRPRFAQR